MTTPITTPPAKDATAPDSEHLGIVLPRLVRHYFGCEATATKVYADPHPFPWMFTISRDGITYRFGGIPNKCSTAAAALKRAWWRCKWLAEGSYNDRYKAMPNAIGEASPPEPQ